MAVLMILNFAMGKQSWFLLPREGTGSVVAPRLYHCGFKNLSLVIGALSFSAGSLVTNGGVWGLHPLDPGLSCLLLPASYPGIVCVKWKGSCLKLHWYFINMLNDHTQAIFTYYSALCNALVMNGSTLLKDLPINQLNMGKKESLFIYEVWERNYREKTLHILLF